MHLPLGRNACCSQQVLWESNCVCMCVRVCVRACVTAVHVHEHGQGFLTPREFLSHAHFPHAALPP